MPFIKRNFGGIIRTEEYLHFGYVDGNGQVIFDETYFGNHIDFQVAEGTPKVIIKTSNLYGTSHAFQLTREMYENINSSQK